MKRVRSASLNRFSCGIAVMAKASAAGRTKTRLVPPLTSQEAASFNTAFLKDIHANILEAGKAQNIHGYLAYGPPGPDAVAFFKGTITSDVRLLEAWYTNFGDCLCSALEQLFDAGHEGAVVVNSDSPTLPTSLLVATAQILSRPGDCVVLGPSTDGGYYLLGVKARHRRLFADIAWSTEHVARQTRDRAAEFGLPVYLLPAWYDVDDVNALRTLHAELFESQTFVPGLVRYRAHHSQQLMRSLLLRGDLANRLYDAAIGVAAE
jgi:rSAM/selenodomain-associated transferase 1